MIDTQETLHFLDYWRVLRTRKEIVIAVSLLVVLTGILVTLAMPKVYMGSCVIAVKEERPDVAVFSPETARYDPLFLRTQFEIIQSRPVIEEVVLRRELHHKLARAYGYDGLPPDQKLDRTVKLLMKNMRVQQYRDTNLIEIQIYLSEPKRSAPLEAAEAANMVAEVYRSQSMLRSRRVVESALDALKDAVEERGRRVSEAEQRLEEIREKYQIDLVSSTTDSALPKMTLQQLELQHVQEQMALEDKKARYEKVLSLTSEALRDAAPYLVGDPSLASLVAAKRKAEVDLSQMLGAQLGPRHPDVVRIKAMVERLDEEIAHALEGLKTGLLADYEAQQAKLLSLQQIVEAAKANERIAESRGYREFDRARADVEHLTRVRDALEMRYVQEQIELRIPRTMVEIVEPARPPDEDEPVSPNFLLNVVLSLLLGLSSGVGLAFFIEYLDTSVKTIEDVERFLGVTVLGVVPQKVRPFVEKGAEAGHAEAYRVLRTNIQFSKNLKGGKTFCVTSGSVGEGKSLTLFNLAYVYAQLGDRVLIVDSDLHRPRQHKILGVSNAEGLANVLVGAKPLDECIMETQVERLSFLPSGKLATGVHGLLDTLKMREVVQTLRERYDFVFFDSPPMMGVSDASLLVREMDGVLLVVQHRKYSRSVSSRAKDMVINVGGNLVGVVLNNINISRDRYYYYQHYNYYPRADRGPDNG